MNVQRQLHGTSDNVAASLGKLASGKRINKAADDAAGLGVSEVLNASTRSMVQAQRNASDGVSLLQIAEGSMEQVSNILVRLRELSVQSATDTMQNRERGYINREYNELLSEIDRISEVTEFNGLSLLKGGENQAGLADLSLHIGIGDGFKANTDTIEISLEAMRLSAEGGLGLEKGAVLGPADGSGSAFERERAAISIEQIDHAMERLNFARATIGAKQNRLETSIANLSVSYENLNATKSRILDTDFAAQTAEFTQQRILQQMDTSLLSQANQAPELVLSLLR